MDEGTQVRIEASTMEGAPDVFLMNQDQVDLYTSGGTAVPHAYREQICYSSHLVVT